MEGQKIPFCLSILDLSVAIFAASAVSFFVRPTAIQAQELATKPKIATVKSMINGDIMCYVTLVGNNGTLYKDVGASFEICENKKTFLNKKVRLSYQKVRVIDCQSAEPCGRKP